MFFSNEFLMLLFYFFFMFVIVLMLLLFSLFLVKQNPLSEKLSSYECGFNPYEDASLKFEIKFFLMGILFMVFDLEMAFLLPLAMIMNHGLSFLGFCLFLFFIFVFVFSFFFEWFQGALSWD